MRFYILVGQAVRGPLTADDIRLLPGLSPDTPVCPEGRDHKDSSNWRAAASYPALFAVLAAGSPDRDGGASRFWRSAVAKGHAAQALAASEPRAAGGGGWVWLLAAALPMLVIGYMDFSRPAVRPAPARSVPPPTPLDRATALFTARLPRDEAQALRAAIGLVVVDGRQEIVLPADGRSLKATARFRYDAKRRELRPLNEAARGLLDIRRAHRKP
jgi:hypothetical protein